MAPGGNGDVSRMEFNSLCNIVTQRVSYKFNYFDVVFLESANPNLAESVDTAINCGVEDIAIYPFFLNEGESVNENIQDIIMAISDKHPFVHFTLLDTYGNTVIEADNQDQHIVAK